MATVPTLITSFFTNNGVPATGLTPIIDIWEITDSSQTKIVANDSMIEVEEGWYKYNFSTYDTETDYIIKVDGGNSLPPQDRFQAFGNETFKDDITDAVWEEAKTDHLQAGTFGEALATVDADIEGLRLDVNSMLTLVDILVKHESNRTKIDKTAKTLTVFDDDGTTPLQVFDLLDSNGQPSIEEIAERNPQ